MELGGLAPFVVFPTADLDKAVEGLMVSKFRNTGQTCVCANNIMIHEDVHDAFVEKLIVKVKEELKFGDVFNGATQGAMINEVGIAKVRMSANFFCFLENLKFHLNDEKYKVNFLFLFLESLTVKV